MIMDESLKRALAAAARAFAEELERDLPPRPAPAAQGHGQDRGQGQRQGQGVVPGSAASMFEVLQAIARINDELGRGANDDEVRLIARGAGMDPRGMAGYYSANLLEKRPDGRWLCPDGRERLDRLNSLRGLVILNPESKVATDTAADDDGAKTAGTATRATKKNAEQAPEAAR